MIYSKSFLKDSSFYKNTMSFMKESSFSFLFHVVIFHPPLVKSAGTTYTNWPMVKSAGTRYLNKNINLLPWRCSFAKMKHVINGPMDQYSLRIENYSLRIDLYSSRMEQHSYSWKNVVTKECNSSICSCLCNCKTVDLSPCEHVNLTPKILKRNIKQFNN